MPTEIRTHRLLLRPLDRTTIRNLIQGPLKGPCLAGVKVPEGWPMEGLVEALPVMFNDLGEDPSSLGWHAWAVVLKGTMELVGDAGFKGAPDRDGAVELGFSLLPRHRGNGYATEAVGALFGYALGTGKVVRIIAECVTSNIASRKVLERSGMVPSMRSGDSTIYRIDLPF